jgi:DNA-binding transcriptional LysR family regulator
MVAISNPHESADPEKMNIEEIETFVCVAELGSFSRASNKLHRTQPAISRRIAMLEQSLDAVLFDRSTRTVALTAQGEALLPHARTMLAVLQDAARAVLDAGGQRRQSTRLDIAVVGTLADRHIVKVLRELERRHPKVSVALTTATSREVSRSIRNGEAEIGVRYFSDADPDVTSITLGFEKLFLVVAADHPVTSKRVRTLRAFADDNWLAFSKDPAESTSFGELLERELRSAGLHDARITCVDSLTAQKRLVQAGFGVTLMPLSSCREEIDAGSVRAINVTSLGARLPVVAIRRRDAYVSDVAKSLLELLADYRGFLTPGAAR